MNIPKIIAVAGPTASGKTALGIELARLYNGEIVSADSMQIYRKMDIGTAKATAEEQAMAVHHMIDIVSPDENYSVARYTEDADICIKDILSRGKMPVIVGGTGLYIDSLIAGRSFADFQEDKDLRDKLMKDYEEKGGEEMLKILSSFDPERAAKLHPSDMRRIVRAMEVYYLTGMTITQHDIITRQAPPSYDAARIILNFNDRQKLYDRINLRVDMMVRDGLFEEVQGLIESGIPDDSTAMQAIGYKEPAMALRGEITREEAVEMIKMGSRRYAKRQLTWFHKTQDALWLMRDDAPDLEQDLKQCIPFLEGRGIVM